MSHAIYLMFNGNAEEAINYYKDKLDGTIEQMQRFSEVPGNNASESYQDKIMHGILNLQGMKIMFSDAMEQRNVTFGDNFSIALDFKTDGDLRRAFEALSTGGQVTMPVEETFWNATFGMCVDKFGINWMVNYDHPKKG
jgi:PhnB protein